MTAYDEYEQAMQHLRDELHRGLDPFFARVLRFLYRILGLVAVIVGSVLFAVVQVVARLTEGDSR